MKTKKTINRMRKLQKREQEQTPEGDMLTLTRRLMTGIGTGTIEDWRAVVRYWRGKADRADAESMQVKITLLKHVAAIHDLNDSLREITQLAPLGDKRSSTRHTDPV